MVFTIPTFSQSNIAFFHKRRRNIFSCSCYSAGIFNKVIFPNFNGFIAKNRHELSPGVSIKYLDKTRK